MPSSLPVLAVVAAGVGAAAAIDLRTRRVPNRLTAGLALTGLAAAAAGVSDVGVTASCAGLVLGLLLMLPAHLLGATGAGDVKLLASSGAILGPALVAQAFLYTLLAGGVLALIVAVRRRRLSQTVAMAGRLIGSGAAAAAAIEHPGADNRFAYAPAIAVGTVLAALGI